MKLISDIEIIEHPLYKIIKEQKIPLWKLRKALGGSPSETILSRTLNGIVPMKSELEKRIMESLGISKKANLKKANLKKANLRSK